jgi:hypothetical protein
MIKFFTKKYVALSVVFALGFSCDAFAGDAFNKFQAEPTAVASQGVMTTSYAIVTVSAPVATSTPKGRIKRVVEPVPVMVKKRIGFASDTGTVNKLRGFNRMTEKPIYGARRMPVIIHEGALTAR